jgi:1,4-alpha-glucan branching enzyme
MIIMFFVLPEQKISSVPYRFVIYVPDANQVDITGSFTGWKSLPMKKMGTTGYWEITLDLQEGEHRYSYILESGLQIPDPSVLARERDDFGGENSVLDVNIEV